jgi:hypothetical protein
MPGIKIESRTSLTDAEVASTTEVAREYEAELSIDLDNPGKWLLRADLDNHLALLRALEKAGVCAWARKDPADLRGDDRCFCGAYLVPVKLGPSTPENEALAASGKAVLVYCPRGDEFDPTHGCPDCGSLWRVQAP